MKYLHSIHLYTIFVLLNLQHVDNVDYSRSRFGDSIGGGIHK